MGNRNLNLITFMVFIILLAIMTNCFAQEITQEKIFDVALITDSQGSTMKAKQLRYEYEPRKEGEFFKVKYGKAKLTIPFKYIKSISRLDIENSCETNCSIILQSGLSLTVNKIGYSWQGKNKFGGDYFIFGDDWRVIEFEHNLIESDNINEEKKSSVLIIDWENVFHNVSKIHYEYAPRKEGDFFDARVGDSFVRIPFSKIIYILMTDNKEKLCEIKSVDGEILKCIPDGYSWGGKNEFGGTFFIHGHDWQAVYFDPEYISKISPLELEVQEEFKTSKKETEIKVSSKMKTANLTLMVITSLTSVFSLAEHDLIVNIDGPTNESKTIQNVSGAKPVPVHLYSIPLGKYKVTAKYGSKEITKEINITGDTLDLEMTII